MPIIAFSGSDDNAGQRIEALAAGADEYAAKRSSSQAKSFPGCKRASASGAAGVGAYRKQP